MYNSLLTERSLATNCRFAKAGALCSAHSFVVNQTLVFQIKFCVKRPALRVAAKRYMPFYKTEIETLNRKQ